MQGGVFHPSPDQMGRTLELLHAAAEEINQAAAFGAKTCLKCRPALCIQSCDVAAQSAAVGTHAADVYLGRVDTYAFQIFSRFAAIHKVAGESAVLPLAFQVLHPRIVSLRPGRFLVAHEHGEAVGERVELHDGRPLHEALRNQHVRTDAADTFPQPEGEGRVWLPFREASESVRVAVVEPFAVPRVGIVAQGPLDFPEQVGVARLVTLGGINHVEVAVQESVQFGIERQAVFPKAGVAIEHSHVA